MAEQVEIQKVEWKLNTEVVYTIIGIIVLLAAAFCGAAAYASFSQNPPTETPQSSEVGCSQKANSYLSTGQQFFDIAYPLNLELRSAQMNKSNTTCYATVEWTDYNSEWSDDYHAFELINIDNGQTIFLTNWMRQCDYLNTISCGQMPQTDPSSADLEPSIQKINYQDFISKEGLLLDK